jgi:hypothetical protein
MGEQMFRTIPAAEPTHDVAPAEDPIPLSVLALDLAEPSVGGWVGYLKGRGIEVLTDDVGRASVSRSDARQLLDEKREAEARQREAPAAAERQAIERDPPVA